jgi:hypothetical protein
MPAADGPVLNRSCYNAAMADEDPTPAAPENELFPLSYANPRLIRRYQNGPVWKSVVRVVGGVMLSMCFVLLISEPLNVRGEGEVILMLCAVGAATLVGLIYWERGKVLKEPLWEGAKDLRAQSYRASASRFDSSGVTVVDPHSDRQ